jgi:cyclopropane-fatty-acyl-phospholipid synthase
MNLLQKTFSKELAKAGITLNGDKPYDIRVNDDRIYLRVLIEGELGFGEGYMDGQWEVDDLAEMIKLLLTSGANKGHDGITGTLLAWSQNFLNHQSMAKSRRVARQHYDIGNDLYLKMLDKRLVYTCGFWQRATTLDQAQEDKLELVCRKLELKPGQRILDVGCGWGSFAKYAAEKYGVEVVGITLSKEQVALGTELCKGLPVSLLLMDYRDVAKNFADTPFDHIVSIGMFEHVGPKNYYTYMRQLSSVLKPDGLFLLHTIGATVGGTSTWLDRYIFPGGHLPLLDQIVEAVRGSFIIENVENFGADYDRTLCAWWENFNRAWPELKATGKYDERFYRMWRFYLLMCAGALRARGTQLWQIVLSPHGVKGVWRVADHILI